MTRNVTTSFRRASEANFADEVFLCFLTISHDTLAEPIRVVWDTVDHAYGGYNFIGFPFDITILSDDENPPVAQLTIQNIDPRIGDSIRLLNSPPRIKIEVISSADFVGPLLAHFSGVDGSTTFVNSGNAIPNPTLTGIGNAQIDGNALLLDGSVDAVSVSSSSEFSVGSGDFEISFRFKVRVANSSSIQVLYDSGGFQYYIYLPTSSSYTILDESSSSILDEIGDPIYDGTVGGVKVFNSTAGTDILASAVETVINTWYRVNLTRNSGTLRLFIDGVQQDADYTDSTFVIDATPVIGADHSGAIFAFNGWIDEVSFITQTPTVIYSADKLFLINVSVDIIQVTGQIVGWDYLQRVWPGPRATQVVFPGLFR